MNRPHQSLPRLAVSWLSALAAFLLAATGRAENPYPTWAHNFDPNVGASPSAKAVAIDKSGFVAVTGFTWSGSEKIYYTALHDPFTGEYVNAPNWPVTYDIAGSGSNEANGVVFDSVGNIIVTGQSQSADGLDYFTRKYDRNGGILWSARYDNNSGADLGLFIAVDSANNVVVTGRSSNGAVSGDDIYTVKYRASDGFILSTFRYTSAGTNTDSPTGLVIDSQNKVIVCGVSKIGGDNDFYLAKYDMSTLAATADWTRTIDNSNNGDDTAQAVAVGVDDSVVVVGRMQKITGTAHAFFARKYNAAGTPAWSQTFPDVNGDFLEGARAVAVDAEGNAFVSGFHQADNNNSTLYTAKLITDSGAIDWFVRAPLFEEEDVSIDDLNPVRLALDPSGNPIVATSTRFGSDNSDFYIGKYSSRAGGAILWERFYGGAFPNGGTDRVRDMAVDPFGNIAIAGDALRQAGLLSEIITFKIGATALATGDPIAGPGVPAGATIAAINAPAAADNGAIATRVTIAAGRKKLAAIVTLGPGKGLQIPGLQGAPAPGIPDAVFKSFLDPLLAPNGEVAFVAKVSGAKASEALGIWTNAFDANGNIQLVLQQGKQVPGLPAGTLLKSITSLSHRNNQLLALIKVSGKTAGVTGSNALVLHRITGNASGVPLVRAGDPIMVDGTEAKIKKITVFTTPKDSAGHGRYHGDARSIARITLDDRRTAVVAVTGVGVQTVVTFNGNDASSMVAGATWSTMGLPAIGNSGASYALLGTLTVGDGDVAKANDTFIGYQLQGFNFAKVAREGDTAPGFGTATYSKLQDPVSSGSQVAFIGSVVGDGTTAKDRTGLWFGPAATVGLIARTNHPSFPATDGAGNGIDARWTAFKSLALPNGSGEGPLFLATISGPDATRSTGTGLWALDSDGTLRKIIRAGDQLGDLTVKKFTVLGTVPGSIGATRSFSGGRTVALLVNFSDRSTGILNIAIP
jgi:hypothetical protein